MESLQQYMKLSNQTYYVVDDIHDHIDESSIGPSLLTVAMEVQQDFHLQQHRRQAWQRPPTKGNMSTSIMAKLLSKPYLIVSVAMSSSDGREGYYYRRTLVKLFPTSLRKVSFNFCWKSVAVFNFCWESVAVFNFC